MKILANNNVFHIFRRTLNLIDYRLVDHGERVAYMVLRMMQKAGRYSQEEMAHACVTAAMHDIGAYKTEEIDKMTSPDRVLGFEVCGVEEHSAYGYLFMENFKTLAPFADALLFHHVPYERLRHSSCKNKELAAYILAADRYDFLCARKPRDSVRESIRSYQGTLFSEEAADLILTAEEEGDLTGKLESGAYLEELFAFMDMVRFTEEELIDFLKLLAYVIDFRSPHTVTHTITTVGIAVELAKFLKLPPEECEAIYIGSILHDIGKIATPFSILEKPGKLTPFEYSVMKEHVRITEEILQDCVDDKIVQIAVRHHEKLDGSGYHKGLFEKDLTLPQRIVAVADMTSALLGRRSYKEPMQEELVKRILEEEAEKGKICLAVVAALSEHFVEITGKAAERSREPLENYERMQKRYPECVRLLRKYDGKKTSCTKAWQQKGGAMKQSL